MKGLEPAYLSVARAEVPELARNRGSGTEVDGHLVSVRLTGLSGREVAQVVLYPAHATLLGLENRLLSGDWPGALMRSGRAPILFFQGALGDQTTRLPPRVTGKPESYARALQTRLDALEASPPDPWPELVVATATAVLPPTDLGASPAVLRLRPAERPLRLAARSRPAHRASGSGRSRSSPYPGSPWPRWAGAGAPRPGRAPRCWRWPATTSATSRRASGWPRRPARRSGPITARSWPIGSPRRWSSPRGPRASSQFQEGEPAPAPAAPPAATTATTAQNRTTGAPRSSQER